MLKCSHGLHILRGETDLNCRRTRSIKYQPGAPAHCCLAGEGGTQLRLGVSPTREGKGGIGTLRVFSGPWLVMLIVIGQQIIIYEVLTARQELCYGLFMRHSIYYSRKPCEKAFCPGLFYGEGARRSGGELTHPAVNSQWIMSQDKSLRSLAPSFQIWPALLDHRSEVNWFDNTELYN